jgi:alpha 1,3-glucosidase
MLLEDGSAVPDAFWDQWYESFPHGKTAVGLSFQFSNSATALSGFPESDNDLDLPDVDAERRYALDYYSHYGYVPFVMAHNSAYEFTPALFWMNPTDMVYLLSRGAQSRDLALISESGFIDFVLFLAEPEAILPQYYQITGFPLFPPAFGFGYHQCRYGYPSQEVVEEVMANLSANGFPQDVQWLDIDHLENYEPFILSKTWWTNATQFFADAATAGLRVVRITDCHMYDSGGYPPFVEAYDAGYLVMYRSWVFTAQSWPGMVGWPDFLRRDVRDWWSTLFPRYNFPENVHVWNDMNEVSASGTAEATLPKDALQFNTNIEVREVHSLYGFSNSAATHDALLSAFPDRRPFVLTRSFFAGTQRYAWHWSGDNMPTQDHLALALSTLLASNLAGLPFSGSDLGGFNAETNPFLLARWYQLGAYILPFYREHNDIYTSPREPYLYKDSNPAQFQAMKTAVIDRYKMLPLLYTAARDACEYGRPFAAPLWFHFPRVEFEAAVAKSQPLIGGRLMVVPQLTVNATNVTAVKPPGLWWELRTGRAMADRDVVSTDWSDHVPAFLRGGTILGVFSAHGMTVEKTFQNNLSLVIAFNESRMAEGSLYFDDLASLAHERGEFLRSAIACTGAYLSVTREGGFAGRPFVESVTIYGALALPSFVIPGGNATFADGVVTITGVWFSLADEQNFTALPSQSAAPALSPTSSAPGPISATATRSASPAGLRTVTAAETASASAAEVPTATGSVSPAGLRTATAAETASASAAEVPTATETQLAWNDHVAIIVGGVVGGVVVVVLLVLVCFWCRRRSRKHDPVPSAEPLFSYDTSN